MTDVDRREFVNRMNTWISANTGVFAHRVDGDILTLVEVATGQERILMGDDIDGIHQGTNRMSGVTYPILLLVSGHQIAVTDLGFCFAPSFASTGEIPGAPPVVSFGDFHRLFQEATLAAEDPARRKESLDLMMLCITIVDGARLVGFNVNKEEDRLETLLRQAEGGGPPVP